MQLKSHPLTAAFILLNLCITVPLAAKLNIWIDEAYSLNTTGGGFFETIRAAIAFENQPPLYFLLLHLWRNLNGSIFFARLFSCLCLSLTLFFAAKVSQRYLNRISPAWFVGAIALHPYAIWTALEIRTYGFAVLLSMLLLLLFFDGYLAEQPQKNARVVYGFLAIAALYTHYFLACILFAHWVTLWLLRRWRDAIFHSLVLVGVGFTFSPLLLVLGHHLAGQGAAMTNHADTVLESVRTMLGRLTLYILPSDFQGLSGQFFSIYRYCFMLVLGGLIVLYRQVIEPRALATFITFLVATGTLTLLLDLTENAKLTSRYSYPLFILTLLGGLTVFSLVPEHSRRKGLELWSVIIVVLYATSLIVTYAPLAKDGDWQRVAAYITAQETPKQPVLVFSAEGLLPLNYYYQGVNSLRGVPRQVPGGQYDLRRFALQNDSEIQEAIAGSSQPEKPLPQQLWLVKAPSYVLDGTGKKACQIWEIDLGCTRLEAFLNRRYDVVNRRDFYGANVRLFQKKRDSA